MGRGRGVCSLKHDKSEKKFLFKPHASRGAFSSTPKFWFWVLGSGSDLTGLVGRRGGVCGNLP